MMKIVSPSSRVRRPRRSLKQARRLRKEMTEAEKHLWYALRQRQLNGWRFRRQAAVGPYIADFLCFAPRFIIEVDGGQHSFSMRDKKRTRFLEREGFHVLRFWNHEVMQEREAVLLKILETGMHLESPPPLAGEDLGGGVGEGSVCAGADGVPPIQTFPLKGEGLRVLDDGVGE